MSVTVYEAVGLANKPSPSIWKNCPNTLLNDLGIGIFKSYDFLGGPTGILAADLDGDMVSYGDAFSVDADTDTVLAKVGSTVNGVLQVDTDGDDNDAAALISEPFGSITRNSGQKLWFEVYISVGDVDADMGTFFGIAEDGALSRDLLSDGVAAGAVIGNSLVGFLQDNGDDNAFDAVYKKDAGTIVTALANVTNATAIASGDRADLTDDTLFKLGLTFDGLQKLRWFVNGINVVTQDVDSTLDQATDYGAILNIKTGAGAAEQFRVDWAQYAYQERA